MRRLARPARHTRPLPLLTCVLALLTAWPAHAADPEVERVRAATTRLINLLVDQGLLTRARAEELLKELDTPKPSGTSTSTPAPTPGSAAAAPASPPTVRVPLIPEFMRQQLKDELRTELTQQATREGWAGPGAVPAWVRGWQWEGDLRSRYQADNLSPDNAPAVSIADTNRNRALTLANTTVDRQRLRVRARLGATVTADSAFSGGLRLTTGSATDPLSSNQTLGTYGNRFTTTLDRGYIRWRPSSDFNAVFGRFGNPWVSTDLVWANDLGFDGVAAHWAPALGSWGRALFTVGAMPVQEVELSAKDKWLYGAQAGAEWSGPGLMSARVALAYYHYANTTGRANATGSSLNDFTAPAFAQKGNTYFNISTDPSRPLLALAADYHLVDLTGSVDLTTFAHKHLVLTADVVRNVGFKEAEVSARVGSPVKPQTLGWQVRAAFGDADVSEIGKWQAFFAYRKLQRDAVPDAFADSDLRGGGTDVKGYTLGGSLGVGKHTTLTLRWLSADSISGAPLAQDTLHLDLLMRF